MEKKAYKIIEALLEEILDEIGNGRGKCIRDLMINLKEAIHAYETILTFGK